MIKLIYSFIEWWRDIWYLTSIIENEAAKKQWMVEDRETALLFSKYENKRSMNTKEQNKCAKDISVWCD